jgi:hypothetical protein
MSEEKKLTNETAAEEHTPHIMTGHRELEYSEKSNLLEQAAYKFQLQDRATPNLYRYLFDYESVPKVSFNHRFVPTNMPQDIWITDTTFRDGQQSTSPFTEDQIVHLFSGHNLDPRKRKGLRSGKEHRDKGNRSARFLL